MKKTVQPDRFHYSLELESMDWFFHGERKSHGMASAFSNYAYMKRRLLSVTKKIHKRILNIATTDEDLKERLGIELDALSRKIKAIDPKNNNDQEIIANLFEIIGLLLGWDRGEFVRIPIFYQAEEERQKALFRRADTKMAPGLWEFYHRRQLVLQMLKDGKTYAQVALIFNIPEANVKQIEKARHIDGFYQEAAERTKKS